MIFVCLRSQLEFTEGKCFVSLAARILIFCSNFPFFFYRYPNPSAFTYERRLFVPFEYALQPPPWYKAEQIAVNKPEVPNGASLKQYYGPQCFVIPGNHGQFLLPVQTLLDFIFAK